MSDSINTWYCDVCGKLIESPAQGYVLFSHSHPYGYHNFRIIHHISCDNDKSAASSNLQSFLGVDGLAYLSSFLSLGKVKTNSGISDKINITDMNNFIDFFRRVQLPHYEEVRRKFNDHEFLESYSDANEILPYIQRTLKSHI